MDFFYLSLNWLENLAVNRFQIITALWNIFLVIIPLVIILFLIKYWRETKFIKLYQKIIALFLGFIWLLFIPNTAYLIADVRHLMDYCPINSPERVCLDNAWMIFFFFSFAVIGWVLFFYLTKMMKDFLAEIFNDYASHLFIILFIPLLSLGILLGLINRWNSWDIFIYPRMLLGDMILYFTVWPYFFDWFLFTAFLFVLYYAGDLLFKKFRY